MLTAPASGLLTWSNGVRTVTVDLYLGTDQAAVMGLDPATRRLTDQAAESFDPGGLAAGTRYWWRVVSRGNDGQTAFGLGGRSVSSSLPLQRLQILVCGGSGDGVEIAETRVAMPCGYSCHAQCGRGRCALPEFACVYDCRKTRYRAWSAARHSDCFRLCVRSRSAFNYFFVLPENLEFVIQAARTRPDWLDEAVWTPGDGGHERMP
jgi:hypothetical protein